MAKTKEPKTTEAKTKAPFQKQRADVYTMMLIVAFLVLTFGCFLLYKELEGYRNEAGDIDFGPGAKDKPTQATLFVPLPPHAMLRLTA